MRPMMRPTASALSAPTQTALQTGQGPQPDSRSRSMVVILLGRRTLGTAPTLASAVRVPTNYTAGAGSPAGEGDHDRVPEARDHRGRAARPDRRAERAGARQ